MGNVHAYSSAPPPPPPSCPPGFTPKTESEVHETENPGPLEEIHSKCKSKLKGVFIFHFIAVIVLRLQVLSIPSKITLLMFCR